MRCEWIRGAALVALAAAGCFGGSRHSSGGQGGTGSDGGPDGTQSVPEKAGPTCLFSTTTAEISVRAIDKVDLLFVVDDSESMAQEQASLQRQVPKLIRALATGERPPKPSFSPAEDLHLGVVSGDMGLVGISGIPGCDGLGDDAIMNNIANATLAGCQATYPRFLTYLAGVNDPDQTATDFTCIAALGTDGCGFEQPLEAGLKALWPSVDVDSDGNVKIGRAHV